MGINHRQNSRSCRTDVRVHVCTPHHVVHARTRARACDRSRPLSRRPTDRRRGDFKRTWLVRGRGGGRRGGRKGRIADLSNAICSFPLQAMPPAVLRVRISTSFFFSSLYIYIYFPFSLSLFSVVSSDARGGLLHGRGGNTYLRGRPRLLPAGGHGAPAVFPTGKSAAIFHYPTRQCICLLCPPAPPTLPARPAPTRKSVVPLPVRSDTGRPHLAGHDNVFIIHRIIWRVGGNQVGRYYAPTIGCVESVIYRRARQKEVWPGRVSPPTFR